uniref:Uncharacterized protein n=1 Tax=Ficedula albicollis TaxID=59894 RepID=A0A803VX13_FICAL
MLGWCLEPCRRQRLRISGKCGSILCWEEGTAVLWAALRWGFTCQLMLCARLKPVHKVVLAACSDYFR